MTWRPQNFEPSRSRSAHAERTENHEDVAENTHPESHGTSHNKRLDHAEDRGNLLYEEYAPTDKKAGRSRPLRDRPRRRGNPRHSPS